MENLTEEQKTAIRNAYRKLEGEGYELIPEHLKKVFPEAFEEPGRITAIVKITTDNHSGVLTENFIEYCLLNEGKFRVKYLKAEILPEVYTAEDMIEFAEYCENDKYMNYLKNGKHLTNN